ncbi:ATP-dependent nuclease [Mycobacterium malmoense]|nr:AAA family ATPase [Mycobacterium malmoense]
MYLSQLSLRHFRSCRDTSVNFAPDLTVIVGENAAGKSAIIDAIRLVAFPASGRQTAWFVGERDLSHGSPIGTPVDLCARFASLSDLEKSIYLAQVVDSHEDLVYTATFATDPAVPKRSILTWGIGDARSEDPEPGLRRRISCVYMPPLRDAVRDLDGSDQALLHDVLRILVGTDSELEENFVETAKTALKKVAEHPLAVNTRDAIQGFFAETTAPNREHVIELNQRKLEMRRVARLLRIQLAERGVPVGDIAATGLGYANLLYIAMIVLQLVRAKDSDLTLLLVEEPEAHLHPQLQLVLLDFLHDQARSSGQSDDMTQPGGKVQVVVTTHSPVLASTVSILNVIVVARDSDGAEWCTKVTAIHELGLEDKDRRKIDRYLNSTRAALLFARDVVLVEGIAEMLVLPAVAQRHLRQVAADLSNTDEASKKDDQDESVGAKGVSASVDVVQAKDTKAADQTESSDSSGLEETKASRKPLDAFLTAKKLLRQFRSATLISVEGVDFEPYLRVLLDGEHPRVDRVVIVTDRDHTGAGDDRRASYEERFARDVEAGRLTVVVGGTTLEAEMFRMPENEAALRAAFIALHPKSGHHWANVLAKVEGTSPDERAETFASAIRAQSPSEDVYLDIAKGDFAHVVAEAIESENGLPLVVPTYLKEAIEAVAHVDAQQR